MVATASPKTCGLRRSILARHAAGDVVERELAGLLGDHGVDHHLEQQVAELVAQRGRVARLDRLDDLLGLLAHVGDQRGVGLLALPGALALQQPHLVGEGLQLRAVRAWHAADIGSAAALGRRQRLGEGRVRARSASPALASSLTATEVLVSIGLEHAVDVGQAVARVDLDAVGVGPLVEDVERRPG